MNRILLTVAEVAELTGLSCGTIRKYVLKKTIPYLKMGTVIRFRVTDIEAWIDGAERVTLAGIVKGE
jgi:excisionase family DNA binding protein